MSPRRLLVGGNWKMHKVRDDARRFCEHLRTGLGATAVDVVLFPSATLLPVVAESLQDTPVTWGGQDIHPEDAGAHTGDISGPQLVDTGCAWVLCGHSERRRDHGESSDLVATKAAAALRNGLKPLVCVGETLEQRQQGHTEDILADQLRPLRELPAGSFDIAYEPIWAIGTGETATPSQAAAAHAFLRQQMIKTWGEPAEATLRILYGGSVKPENAADMILPQDIDGFLVGGASLDAAQFLAIISACGR